MVKLFKKIIIAVSISILFISCFKHLKTSVTIYEDSYIYNLPYAVNYNPKVVQGYGGLFTHRYRAAIDFNMPVGTPIYAAREGTIYSYKESSNTGGILPSYNNKANYIIIQHGDGSFGCYWHLKHNGVLTKSGKVVKGQLIGYSGNTGFTLSPHLHFTVKRILNFEKNSFVKTKFATSSGVQFLKAGKRYFR
jgi:murein DD-endopeptidase MepM/ murein hydrolase activator NlpD